MTTAIRCSTSTGISSRRSPARRRSPAGGARHRGPARRRASGGGRPCGADHATGTRPLQDGLARGRSRGWSTMRERFGIPYIPMRRPPPGHRPRHRAGAGLHAAGRRRWSAATAIPARTAPSARSPSASAPANANASSRRRRCARRKQKTHARCMLDGALRPAGVEAKDLILAVIARIGVGGGIGYAIEYAGSAVAAHVDGGAHDALQHDDRGRQPRRHGRARRDDLRLAARAARSRRRATRWDAAVAYWRTLPQRSRRGLRPRGRDRRPRRSRPA